MLSETLVVSFSRSNTRFTSPQICHMLPLDYFKHTSNSGTIQASNSFDFHEWSYITWGMTRCTKQVLSNGWMTCDSTLPCFARRRGMSYMGCINTYLRSQVCSIHSLAYKTFFSSSGLVEISASWSSVPTLSMQMFPFCWWSLMKWWWTSMCFFLNVELDCWWASR